MAISTYAELKSSVATWMHRSDLTAIIPDFIRLAESQIRRDVECRAMEATATGTLAATTLSFPTRFTKAIRVTLGGYVKEYVPPAEFHWRRNNSGDVYTVIGDEFHFQSSTADYEIEYYASFAPFSDDSDTNWLLTNAPEIYLFGALVEGATYVKGDPTLYAQKYQAAVAQLRRSENKAAYPGPVTVRVQQVV